MGRSVVIGDVHGCFEELMRLLDAAQLCDADRVVSVGDRVGRDPDPGAVVAWFLARPGAVVRMGNHERKHVRGVLTCAQQITRLQPGAAYDGAVAWMRGLPCHGTFDGIDAVHAAALPGLALSEQPGCVTDMRSDACAVLHLVGGRMGGALQAGHPSHGGGKLARHPADQ